MYLFTRTGKRLTAVTIDQIFCILEILEKKWECNGTIHKLFIDLIKTYDSVAREVLYNIFIEFGIPKKIVRLLKMCLNETYNKVHEDWFLSDAFTIYVGLKKEMHYHLIFSTLL